MTGTSDGRGFTTRAIHDGTEPPGILEEPVGQPIWLTADYLYDSLEHYADVINDRRPGFVYGRTGNPTHVALHRVLASLEGAEAALSFASGMGALHSTLTALVGTGGEVVAQRTVYGGTFHLLDEILAGYGIATTFVDASPGAVRAALTPRTGAVLVETIANPTFRVTDVRARRRRVRRGRGPAGRGQHRRHTVPTAPPGDARRHRGDALDVEVHGRALGPDRRVGGGDERA